MKIKNIKMKNENLKSENQGSGLPAEVIKYLQRMYESYHRDNSTTSYEGFMHSLKNSNNEFQWLHIGLKNFGSSVSCEDAVFCFVCDDLLTINN